MQRFSSALRLNVHFHVLVPDGVFDHEGAFRALPTPVLAASEITWLTADPPAELQARWTAEYSEIGTASKKFAVLERHGFMPIGYFPLPVSCWLDNYYRPLQARFPSFLDKLEHSEVARAIVAAEERETALYERHQEHVSYGFYVARKVGAWRAGDVLARPLHRPPPRKIVRWQTSPNHAVVDTFTFDADRPADCLHLRHRARRGPV